MEEGGNIRRGKISRFAKSNLFTGFLALVAGFLMIMCPVNEMYRNTFAEIFMHGMGFLLSVIGTSIFMDGFNRARHDLWTPHL